MGNTMSLRGLKDAPLRQMLDEGIYEYEVTKSVFEPSKQKGTPGLQLTLRVVGGPTQKNGDTPNNRNSFFNIWFSEKSYDMALSQTKGLMIACELDVDSIDEDNIDPAIFVGRHFLGTVYHEVDKTTGEPREVVKKPERVLL